MCAIIDANVVHEVFGVTKNEAGQRFYEWVSEGKVGLVVGGKLDEELQVASELYRKLTPELQRSGKLTKIDNDKVNNRTEELLKDGSCKSDDEHVVALAQVSGARLLYSNDNDLQQDFKNSHLIHDPQGKIYSTKKTTKFNRTKRTLLNKNQCRSQ